MVLPHSADIQVMLRQMIRNFERISQILRETGHYDRSFEYVLIAQKLDKIISEERENKAIVCTKLYFELFFTLQCLF